VYILTTIGCDALLGDGGYCIGRSGRHDAVWCCSYKRKAIINEGRFAAATKSSAAVVSCAVLCPLVLVALMQVTTDRKLCWRKTIFFWKRKIE
jgi:hypothetical protein